MSTKVNSLAKVTAALQGIAAIERSLASIKTMSEAVGARDRAQTLAAYLKATRQSRSVQNRSALVKALCERRVGEFLREVPRAPGGRPKKNSAEVKQSFDALLQRSKIDRNEAVRWQDYALVPESALKRIAIECDEDGDELTITYIVTSIRPLLQAARAKKKAKAKKSKKSKKSEKKTEEAEHEEESADNEQGGEQEEAQDETQDEQQSDDESDEDDGSAKNAATAARNARLVEVFREALRLASTEPPLPNHTRTLKKWIVELS